MKNFRKDFFREIGNNKGRFLSVLFIVMLGCAFLSGIRSTKGDMLLSADTYFDVANLMDIKVQSTLGLTEDDLADLSAIDGVEEAVGSRTVDVLEEETADTLALKVIAISDSVNKVTLTEGRLPENETECLVDEKFLTYSEYGIGDTITFTSGSEDTDLADSLNETTFTIVGSCTIPYYLDLTRGYTNIGSGSLDAFVMVEPEAFCTDYYTEIDLTVKGAIDTMTFSEEYYALTDPVVSAIEDMEDDINLRRYQAIRDEAQEKIDDANAEIEDGKQEIEDAKQELADAKQELEDGWAELADAKEELAEQKQKLEDGETSYNEGLATYNENLAQVEQLQQAYAAACQYSPLEAAGMEASVAEAEAAITAAKVQLDASRAELDDGWAQIAEAEQKIADSEEELTEGQEEYDEQSADAEEEIADAEEDIAEGEEKVADAQADLDELDQPELYIYDRDDMDSVSGIRDDADRIHKLGNVFPIIFFLVAALVSLTTMTRMVEEQRQTIGTYKALGYSDRTITMRYFSYAMMATVIGGVIGVVLGEKFLPWVIITAYKILYTGLPEVLVPLNGEQAAIAIGAAVLCTGVATLGASMKALSAKPAELMRPLAPAAGKRILLERIPFLWKHFNFTWKSSTRNLFRYKKRFIMTVLGVGGCMGVLLVAFGLNDSISVVAKNQYTNLFKYDALVAYNTDATEADIESLKEATAEVEESMEINTDSVTLISAGDSMEVTLMVPLEQETLLDFFTFRDRVSGENYEFPTDGVAISEKTATMLDLSVGDTISIRSDERGTVQSKVSVIFENYVLHYIFMTPEYYRSLYGEPAEANELLLKYEDNSSERETALGEILTSEDAVAGVVFITDLQKDIDDMLSTLNYVVWVLILAAALLAFVVLYNLNTINISERQRELATLKVLGFYDKEVADYVFRENSVLTVLGIIFGLFFGTFLHRFIITTVEVDKMMFGRNIEPVSYLLGALMTLVFAYLVNLMMHKRLSGIDMIESLKSVE